MLSGRLHELYRANYRADSIWCGKLNKLGAKEVLKSKLQHLLTVNLGKLLDIFDPHCLVYKQVT